MNIRQSTPPNMIGQTNVPIFRKTDFDAFIFLKGYDVVLENGLACPCRGTTGSAKPTCQNCLGTGWFFINPLQTKAVLTSINNPTKYKPWSPEYTGTISITVRDEDKISFMDRVTLKSRYTTHTEVVSVRDTGTQKFVFCSYKVKRVNSIFIYQSDTQKLTRLTASQYAVKVDNEFVIQLTGVSYPTPFNGAISVEYMHEIAYNVVDIPHDLRSTFVINDKGQNVESNMPMQAIARRSHLVMGEPTNYSANNLQDNSYL